MIEQALAPPALMILWILLPVVRVARGDSRLKLMAASRLAGLSEIA